MNALRNKKKTFEKYIYILYIYTDYTHPTIIFSFFKQHFCSDHLFNFQVSVNYFPNIFQRSHNNSVGINMLLINQKGLL